MGGHEWPAQGPAILLPALIAIPIAPLYLLSGNFTLIWWAFVLQGASGSGGFASQAPSYLSERFPTEVRATAAGFCYHQGAIRAGWSRRSTGLVRDRRARPVGATSPPQIAPWW